MTASYSALTATAANKANTDAANTSAARCNLCIEGNLLPAQRKRNANPVKVDVRSCRAVAPDVRVCGRLSAMMDIDATVERSVAVSDIVESLSHIEDHFISWAVTGRKLLAGYARDVRRLHKVAAELPEEWHQLAVVQVAGMEVMRRPAMVRKYLAQHREDLSREQRGLLREVMRRPWFWTLFSVTAQVRGDLYRVVDHLSDCERLFYSPALTDLTRQGERLFFTAAYSNGLCCQTFGVVHYHRGFQPYDFVYLAKALHPDTLRIQGLEAAVAARPAYFLLLARWAEIPEAVFREQPVRFCAHEVAVRSFSVERCAADFEITAVPERRQVVEGKLRDRSSPAEIAQFYYDAVKGVLTVIAMGPDLYRELAQLLREQAELPDDPEWFAGGTMALVARDLPGVVSPIVKSLQYQRLVEDARKTDDGAAAALEPINAFLRELSRRRNLGVEYRLEELATRYGVAPETARELEATLKRTVQRYEISLPGGIADYTPPPPEVRRHMPSVPSKSTLFTLDFSPAARRELAARAPRVEALLAERRAAGLEVETAAGGGAERVALEMLPRLLDDLFFAHWQAKDATVLAYTLCLLHHAGATPQRVSDYAAEVLRLFWQVLLPGKASVHVRSFIENYAVFCRRVLEPLGVVEIEGEVDRVQPSHARCRMTAGPLLHSFFRLSRYWE